MARRLGRTAPLGAPTRGVSLAAAQQEGPSTSPPLGLASKQQRIAAFSLFSASSAGLGVLALAAPDLLLSLVLPGATVSALDVSLLRIAGGTMAISCLVEYCLKVR